MNELQTFTHDTYFLYWHVGISIVHTSKQNPTTGKLSKTSNLRYLHRLIRDISFGYKFPLVPVTFERRCTVGETDSRLVAVEGFNYVAGRKRMLFSRRISR